MKILISILLISGLGLFSDFSYNNPIQDNCSCYGSSCGCSANCSGANCACNTNSCNCGCGDDKSKPDDYLFLPTANAEQNENSIAIQEYFNNLGTETGTTIAGYVETLRNAIANKNLETYAKNAPLLDAAIENLTEAEQNAYTTWILGNLTPIKD